MFSDTEIYYTDITITPFMFIFRNQCLRTVMHKNIHGIILRVKVGSHELESWVQSKRVLLLIAGRYYYTCWGLCPFWHLENIVLRALESSGRVIKNENSKHWYNVIPAKWNHKPWQRSGLLNLPRLMEATTAYVWSQWKMTRDPSWGSSIFFKWI